MSGRMSRFLPPSLGTLFGQPVEHEAKPVKAMPPASIPGAFNAPELCTLIETYRPDLMQVNRSVAEVKLDGLRCLYIAGQLVTREGSPFEAASHCLPFIERLEIEMGEPMFFDGEYVEDGGLEATESAFRSRKGAGVLWLFDAVPFSQWQYGAPSRDPLLVRKEKLLAAFRRTGLHRDESTVGFINHATVIGPADVEAYAQSLWAQGYEGLVIKDTCTRYQRKRTSDWMKVKARTKSEMVVVDVMGCTREGRETAKSLQVRLQNHDAKPCMLPVRGGLADTIWSARSHLVGRTVQVEHAGFTGGGQPREAVLSRITLPELNERDS
jgi:ATP-dependent DNA ligase